MKTSNFLRHYLLSWVLTAGGTWAAHTYPQFAPCVVAIAGFLAHQFGLESGVHIGKVEHVSVEPKTV